MPSLLHRTAAKAPRSRPRRVVGLVLAALAMILMDSMGCALPDLATKSSVGKIEVPRASSIDHDNPEAGKVVKTDDQVVRAQEDEDESTPEEPPVFFRTIRQWMQDDDPNGSEEGEDHVNRLAPRSDTAIDISRPGADTSNFPNSPFTLPQGRFYIENSPVTFYGPSRTSAKLYNWEFLLRYGLTDRLELRLFSNGFTDQYSAPKTTGFSPLAFDLKMHFWDENKRYLLPAVGLEVFIETNLGSKAFSQGTQPSINLLFSHSLPYEFEFEWNVGIQGNVTNGPRQLVFYNLALQWSLERRLFDDVFVFTHGYLNNAALPRFGQTAKDTGADILVTGVGAQWNATNRLAFFGSYNFGLTNDSPSRLALFGFAVAF